MQERHRQTKPMKVYSRRNIDSMFSDNAFSKRVVWKRKWSGC